ncbi:Hcp family type VI secretion system effector [Lelliottia nimipressuralis]|uniref:Hcp family type VI secretion system effector n=1 Tax=Lelliottia nimipressuralis TaxID=69220 RepID=A0ABY3P6T4_9ENTR|nr:Hcp family type VI secretion system effector [Lelliottia nimipressuralis]RXJ16614.1 Hcp family type VI secretion system effector [Lelliottia nimipressuralis]TYT35147.1 Hcp family type VI secretion system effector [Lelliottia nimipressuralis]
MAGLVYLSLVGEMQGLISSGCLSHASVGNKAQVAHSDQILIYSLSHALSRERNVNHHHVSIVKPLDKSSPLLAKAITDNESLSCVFDFYRTDKAGRMECYYQLKLTDARITELDLHIPHSVTQSEKEAQETISFSYKSIGWEHINAGTSTYSLWEENIFQG